jgi:hypothetical protein
MLCHHLDGLQAAARLREITAFIHTKPAKGAVAEAAKVLKTDYL